MTWRRSRGPLRWQSIPGSALALLACCGLWMASPSAAQEGPAAGQPAAADTAAKIAEGTAMVLSGGSDLRPPDLAVTLVSDTGDVVQLSDLVGSKPTVLFYFSSTCHHCISAAPDIIRLRERLGEAIDIILIASGSNGMSSVTKFADDARLGRPVYKDFSRQFSSRNHATSTPTMLIVRSTENGSAEALAEYRPFAAGLSLVAEIRLRVLLNQDPWAAFETGHYSGPKACGACHLGEYMSWGLTHHSVAYWTLYQRKRAEDTACVGCHVTGMGEEGGFVVGDHGGVLADVSCEACHGPGGKHAGSGADAKASCVACHDKDHSVRFDLQRALPHIDHHAAAGLNPTAYQQARQRLVDGDAPRPLTAFPEGRNLGAQACASCHAAEHASWQKSPHAKALKTLRAKGSAKDLSCLSCHAVEKRIAQSPDDYYSEGVSCEACHGPGEDHVAAGGGTENILGMGTSCPECIIDAVCTRCHTPEHDPDWSLQTALPKVGHR